MARIAGTNTIDGTDGLDWLWGRGGDVLSGRGSDDELDGGDVLPGSTGSTGNDGIDGEAGNDLLRGGTGRDELDGDAGHDALHGGAGHDELDGGSGRDRLFGGTGDDILPGGTGADVFEFDRGDGRDRITDFRDGTDRILVDDVGVMQLDAIIQGARQVGDDVRLIIDASTSVLIENFGLSRLGRSDFVLDD